VKKLAHLNRDIARVLAGMGGHAGRLVRRSMAAHSFLRMAAWSTPWRRSGRCKAFVSEGVDILSRKPA